MSQNPQDRPIGAKAKIARAQQLKAQGYFDGIQNNVREYNHERIYAMLFVVVMACGLAWLLTDGPIAAGLIPLSGSFFIDEVLLTRTPLFMGDPLIDLIIIVGIRAVVLLLIAGVIPAVSWAWTEIADRPLMSPYRTMWGVTLALAIIALTAKPIFTSLFLNFM